MKDIVNPAKRAILIISGLALGFVNGYMGSGAGVLTVLVLLYVLKMPARKAHATAILVVLPLCAASSVVYFINNPTEWLTAVLATIGVTAGGALGAFMLSKLKNKYVTLIFAVILVVAGIRMFF